jgi:hypothetical protein
MSPSDESRKVSQDRGFKTLFETYRNETLEFFVPDIIRARGRPTAIQVLMQNEVPLADLRQSSRFLDIALIATFADGSTIILIEHWSDDRAIDFIRVALYVISLKSRHRHATVIPVIFVTDPTAGDIPERWTMSESGIDIITLRVRVTRITAASIPELHRLAPASRVAAALLALAHGPGIDSAVRAAAAFAAAPGTIDDLKRLLPFIEDLAKLTVGDKVEYQRRLLQEPNMSIIESWLAERHAEGLAQGELTAIHNLVSKGRLSIDDARAEIADLVTAGVITREQADAALVQLG